MKIRAVSLAAVGLCALLGGMAAASAAPYDNIVVFGDSLSDVGNYYLATGKQVPSAKYYDVDPAAGTGRFSNDELWIEHLASTYGVTLMPSTGKSAGLDYAWAYAQVAAEVHVTSPVSFTVPSLPTQVATYLAHVKQKADPNALYVIWGGTADLLYDIEHKITPDDSAGATRIANMVKSLKAAGARNFMIPTVADIQLFPEIRSLGLGAAAHGQTLNYNNAVDKALANSSLAAGISVTRPDIFRLQNSVRKATSGFGFKDVGQPCVTDNKSGQPAALCSAALQPYAFYWDGRNFAEFANSLFAGSGVGSIPQLRGAIPP